MALIRFWPFCIPIAVFSAAGIPVRRYWGSRALAALAVTLFLASDVLFAVLATRSVESMAVKLLAAMAILFPSFIASGLVIEFAGRRRWPPIVAGIASFLIGAVTTTAPLGVMMLIRGLLGSHSL